MSTPVTRLLRIDHPVIQAPMAGGITTPGLVAAVSNAGGLGSLGAGYMAPEALRKAVSEIRSLTQRPFAVNLFVPEPFDEASARVRRVNELMEPYRAELGIGIPDEVGAYARSFADQLAVVIEERVPVFSFTFGVPAEEQTSSLKEAGTAVIGTATTVREALTLEAAGVDAVTGQGAEAGGHRGTFLGDFADATVGTFALIPQLADALRIPVIASGGVADGRGLAAALMLGAGAVQMGTAFLACEESGAHPEYKRAVLEATEESTAITRAFSGKPARAIRNRFLKEMEDHEGEIPPYPIQNAWTKDIRDAAKEQSRPEFMSLWAGQAAGLSRPASAAEVVESVVAGAQAALRRGEADSSL
ncbi:MAG: nitronate monooxygenase [Actinomycetota bacterium]|nr:nitronate monooxygenase [Actinomycetota bacterium]